MDMPLNAKVLCTDGPAGKIACLILNPITQEVTHIVVQENALFHPERLVPITMVAETTPDQVWLRCTRDELMRMDRFVETEFVRIDSLSPEEPEEAFEDEMVAPYLTWPYATPMYPHTIPIEHERIPPHELAVRRGARVDARDGHIGHVDEFLVDPDNGHMTHLVLREGHVWGQQDLTIPIAEIDHIDEEAVYLKLNKHQTAALPAIPVHRHWPWRRAD